MLWVFSILLALCFQPLSSDTGSRLSGKVVGPDGQPLQGATVRLYTATEKSGPSLRCPSCYPDCSKRSTTDSAGKFTFSSLDPNLVFRVLVVADKMAPRIIEGVDPGRGQLSVQLQLLNPEKLSKNRVLYGRVVDPSGAPVSGAIIMPVVWKDSKQSELWHAHSEGIDPLAVTNLQGEFLVTSTKPGFLACLQVDAAGYAKMLSPWVQAGGNAHVFQLQYGVSVRGRLLQNGKGVANAVIVLVQENRSLENFFGPIDIITDHDGFFMLRNVADNTTYYLHGSMTDSQSWEGAVPVRKLDIAKDSKDPAPLTLIADPVFSIKGKLILPEVRGLPKPAQLALTPNHTWESQVVNVDENGSFAFLGVPPGQVTISVKVAGYRLSETNKSANPYLPNSLTGCVTANISQLALLLVPGTANQLDTSKMSYKQKEQLLVQWTKTELSPLQGIERAKK
jgi:protocatechuate 3,4-dioxygenase beta subunit